MMVQSVDAGFSLTYLLFACNASRGNTLSMHELLLPHSLNAHNASGNQRMCSQDHSCRIWCMRARYLESFLHLLYAQSSLHIWCLHARHPEARLYVCKIIFFFKFWLLPMHPSAWLCVCRILSCRFYASWSRKPLQKNIKNHGFVVFFCLLKNPWEASCKSCTLLTVIPTAWFAPWWCFIQIVGTPFWVLYYSCVCLWSCLFEGLRSLIVHKRALSYSD